MKYKLVYVLIILIALSAAGCTRGGEQQRGKTGGIDPIKPAQPSPVEKITPGERDVYALVVLGAREEVKKGVTYDASYRSIDYPGGDVPPEVGACTDVVVRAYRNAGIDLQQLVHEDMQANFGQYPQNWGLSGPDPNIDHRRVPNLVQFFSRHGQKLATSVEENKLSEWQWGDVVFWKFPNGLDHCGIVSDRTNKDGLPLAIHNAGIAREEDCMTRWEITGHYRYP